MGESGVLIFAAHVEFAKHSGFNACIVQTTRPGHFIAVKGNANVPRVYLVDVFACDETHAARDANGAVAIGACEVCATLCQRVEVWCLYRKVAIARHAGVVLVGADDEDVGFGHGFLDVITIRHGDGQQRFGERWC